MSTIILSLHVLPAAFFDRWSGAGERNGESCGPPVSAVSGRGRTGEIGSARKRRGRSEPGWDKTQPTGVLLAGGARKIHLPVPTRRNSAGKRTAQKRGRRASSLLKPKGTDAAVRRDSAGEWSRRDRITPPLILSATERRTSLFQMRVFIRSLRRKICTQTELPHPARVVRDLKEIFGT